MPYRTKNDLPKQTQKLPSEAKEIYKDAFNNAEKFYSNPEKKNDQKEDTDEIAAKVAWSAVKRKFKKVKDSWEKNSSSNN